jgi:hypothetical protein
VKSRFNERRPGTCPDDAVNAKTALALKRFNRSLRRRPKDSKGVTERGGSFSEKSPLEIGDGVAIGALSKWEHVVA